VENWQAVDPLVASSPVTLEIERPETWAETPSGAQRVNETTHRWVADDAWSAMQWAMRGVENAAAPI